MSSRFTKNEKDYIKCLCDGLNEWIDIAKINDTRYKCPKCEKYYGLPNIVIVEKSEIDVAKVNNT